MTPKQELKQRIDGLLKTTAFWNKITFIEILEAVHEATIDFIKYHSNTKD